MKIGGGIEMNNFSNQVELRREITIRYNLVESKSAVISRTGEADEIVPISISDDGTIQIDF